MLAKKYKLAKSDFSFLLKRGKRIKGDWFGIVWIGSKAALNCFGIIIPLSAIKKATQRNSLKREIFKLAEKYIPDSSVNKTKILLRVFRKPNQKEKEKGLRKLEEILQDLTANN